MYQVSRSCIFSFLSTSQEYKDNMELMDAVKLAIKVKCRLLVMRSQILGFF
jgi:hypothetical protein